MVAEAGVSPGDVDQLIHGTTLATNALIERKGARTAQIATAGFRDVLEMAHENRFDQYDLGIDRSPPLIERRFRLEFDERIAADGQVLKTPDWASVDRLVETLQAMEIESLAITLLHAYANPEHEQQLAKAISARMPKLAISLSSEVSPEIREFERFVTTCANAYVQPLMSRYLSALSDRLGGLGYACPLFLVTSSGDLTDLRVAMAYPVRLVESGPAGGAVLAAGLARAAGLEEVLAFDMGGTTAKLCPHRWRQATDDPKLRGGPCPPQHEGQRFSCPHPRHRTCGDWLGRRIDRRAGCAGPSAGGGRKARRPCPARSVMAGAGATRRSPMPTSSSARSIQVVSPAT